MAIKGSARKDTGSEKYVGLFEGEVVAINPSREEFKDILGIELPEESKADEYKGETRDGNTYVRVDFWLKEVKDEHLFKVSFYLEDRTRTNKDETKTQYINNAGVTSWADDESSLQKWFTARPYREAKIGEEELYEFLKYYIPVDTIKDPEAELEISFKRLMKGNYSELQGVIGDPEVPTSNVTCLATVTVKDGEDEVKEYQTVYNKAFGSPRLLAKMRLIDYSDMERVEKVLQKHPKDLRNEERFVAKVAGEYGCKDFFKLVPLEVYNSEDNFASSQREIEEGDASY